MITGSNPKRDSAVVNPRSAVVIGTILRKPDQYLYTCHETTPLTGWTCVVNTLEVGQLALWWRIYALSNTIPELKFDVATYMCKYTFVRSISKRRTCIVGAVWAWESMLQPHAGIGIDISIEICTHKLSIYRKFSVSSQVNP